MSEDDSHSSSSSSSDDLWFELLDTNPLLRKKRRSEWVHELYRDHESKGEFFTLCSTLWNYPDRFFRYYRMSQGTFDYILHAIAPSIEKFSTFRTCISPEERLTLAIR